MSTFPPDASSFRLFPLSSHGRGCVCECLPRVSGQLAHGSDVSGLLCVCEEGEVLGNLPYEDLAIVGAGGDNAVIERVPASRKVSSAGLDKRSVRRVALGNVRPHQSVSRTTAVWPRKRGIWSGSLPLSLSGMTANAPPPPDSQLTDRYSGFALTRLVSQAFLLMWMLS